MIVSLRVISVFPPKVIGEIGVWQLEKSLIVFLVSIPGLAQIFLTAFLLPKIDFWCDDSEYAGVDNETLKVSSPNNHLITLNVNC